MWYDIYMKTEGAVINPVKEIRQKEGLTLTRFASQAGCHYQAVYLTECGCYPYIYPKLMNFIELRGYDKENIESRYKESQKYMRIISGSLVNSDEVILSIPTIDHPFINFRLSLGLTGLSRMGFAKTFCIHPGFLYTLERGKSKGLSAQLKEALLQAGFKESVIEELDFRCREYSEGIIHGKIPA